MSDSEAAIPTPDEVRGILPPFPTHEQVARLEAELAAARQYGEAMEREFNKAGAELAAVREREAKLREFVATTEEWAGEQGFDGLAERARAALADGEGEA